MSAPKVDVLQFFDDLVCYLSGCDDLAGYEIAQAESAKALVAELIDDNKRLADALSAVITIDIRGHQLQDRLQFSDLGRAVLAKIDAARPALARAGGGK